MKEMGSSHPLLLFSLAAERGEVTDWSFLTRNSNEAAVSASSTMSLNQASQEGLRVNFVEYREVEERGAKETKIL